MDAVEKGVINSGKSSVIKKMLENKSKKMNKRIMGKTEAALGGGEDFGKNHPFRRQYEMKERLRKKAADLDQKKGVEQSGAGETGAKVSDQGGKEKKTEPKGQKFDLSSVLGGRHPEVIKNLFQGEGKEAIKELITSGLGISSGGKKKKKGKKKGGRGEKKEPEKPKKTTPDKPKEGEETEEDSSEPVYIIDLNGSPKKDSESSPKAEPKTGKADS